MSKKASEKIPQTVRDQLKEMTCVGNVAQKYPGTLDRKQYQALDEVLQALKGKWNRKQNGHVFPSEAGPILKQAYETGEYVDAKKAYEFFPTPQWLAEQLVELAYVTETELVLEPSAGDGSIVEAVLKIGASVRCYELNQDHKARLVELIGEENDVMIGDFLEMEPLPCHDKVVMNPPFSNGQDMAHVRHAFDFLVEGGKLVSVMSPHFTFASDKKSKEFKAWFDDLGGKWEELPANTFKSSGTSVRTVVVELWKM